MAISFPASPDTGDTFQAAGRTWIYDGSSWRLTPVGLNAVEAYRWEPSTTELVDSNFEWFYGWKYEPSTGRLTLDEINDNTTVRIPAYRPGNVGGVYNGMLTEAEIPTNVPKHEIVDMTGESYYNWFTSLAQVTFEWDGIRPTHMTMEV
jgi:hypothetical protein